MKITSDSVTINFEYFNSFIPKRNSVLMLHGFIGSLEDWKDISPLLDERFNYIGIDLIGHDKSDSPADVNKYSPQTIVKHINDVLGFLSIEKAFFIGYSMGGRAALNYAVRYPNKIIGLILESTVAEIESETERENRIKNDEELANYIESNSIEDFVELWMNKEIFNTQRRFSNEKLENIKRKKTLNSKIGLANSLRGFGTGKMKYLHENLSVIQCPVLLISGELDTKFTKINAELKQHFLNAEHSIIKNAGHNTHLEEPYKFVNAVNGFLKKF
jgi:2-succinyl-6-hydroxy-2,4-cyclohexadiene-1-carboxylate synthase